MFESFLGVNPWTALFILLNTLTIFFVAGKFLFKPVMQIIADRQKEIDDMYASAGTAQQEAESLRAEYQQKLSAAQQTSERLVREAVARGQNREEEIIRKADKQRASYYNYYATGNWGDVSNYDLCVDTGTLGIEGCVDLICKCVEIKQKMTEEEEKEW